MSVVEVQFQCAGGAIPSAVAPADVQKVAVRAGVQLTPVLTGAGAAVWTFTAEDNEDLQDLLQDGLAVAGVRLALTLVKRPVTMVAEGDSGDLRDVATVTQVKEMVEMVSGKSVTVVPNAVPYTFEAASQADADAIVAAGAMTFKVLRAKHRVVMKILPPVQLQPPAPAAVPARTVKPPQARPARTVQPPQSDATAQRQARPAHAVQPPQSDATAQRYAFHAGGSAARQPPSPAAEAAAFVQQPGQATQPPQLSAPGQWRGGGPTMQPHKQAAAFMQQPGQAMQPPQLAAPGQWHGGGPTMQPPKQATAFGQQPAFSGRGPAMQPPAAAFGPRPAFAAGGPTMQPPPSAAAFGQQSAFAARGPTMQQPCAAAFGQQPAFAAGGPAMQRGGSFSSLTRQPPLAGGLTSPQTQWLRRIAKVLIFHDVENCPMPRGIFSRDGQLLSHGGTPEQHINAFALRDNLLRQVLGLIEGAAAAEPGRLQDLKHEWNFVLQYNPQNPWHPHERVMEDLYQIATVTPCGTKPGAVDVKIKTLLKQVEKIYRDAAQEEKDRTLIVLISGDRDFVEDVRDLRQPFKQKSGLQVVVVYSAAHPPRQALLDAVGDPRMALGIWQQLVDSSRGQRPGRTPPRGGTGTATPPRPQRPAYSPGPPVLPLTDLVRTYSLKTTFAFFLSVLPQVLAPLKDQVSGLHPALMVELQQDIKARSHSLRLRIMTGGGRLGQPSGPDCAAAAQLVQSFQDGLREATLSELKGIPDDEKSDHVVAAPLPGVSGDELKQNRQLTAMSRQYQVLVFIPNLGQAVRKLRDNELFIVAGNTAEVANDDIIKLCWQTFHVRCQVDRSSTPPVLVIGQQGEALNQAKRALTSSGFFSESPKVNAQQHVMILYYPSAWTPQQLAAFRKKHRLDFVESTEPPRVGRQRTTVKISCSTATRNELLRISTAPGSLVQCKAFEGGASAGAAAAVVDSCSVILVYQRGNEQGRDAVWHWLLEMTNKTEDFHWPGNLFIERQLLKRNWRAISEGLRELGVEPAWDAAGSGVKVTGPVLAVSDAVSELQDRFNRILVVDLGLLEKVGCPNLEAALKRLLEDWTTRAAQKAGGERQGAEDSDEEGTGSTSLEGSQGPSRQLRNRLAFSIEKGKISLAYFEGDEDLVKVIREDLGEYLASYIERGWQLPQKQKCNQAALAASYKQEWTTTIAQKMGLTHLDWVRSAQGGHGLVLCGPSTNVLDAEGFLEELFTRGHQTELMVYIDFVPNALLKMKYHKERRAKIIQETKNSFKSVRITQSTDRSIRCAGEGVEVTKAHASIEELIRQFAKEQAQEKLELTCAQLDFLQGEGKTLLRDLHTHGVFYRLVQQSKARLAHARLVTGCDLEVWKADAVQDFQDVEVLVNSANEKLQHGGGIAADIARAAGAGLEAECQQLVADRGGSLKVGEVVVTGAYNLDERGYSRLLHAVAPRYPAAGSELEATMGSVLTAASARGVKSLVLPLLGAGIFGWPLQRAVGHILDAIGKWAEAEAAKPEGARSSLKRIVLVDLLEDRARAAAERLQQLVEEPAQSSPQAPEDEQPPEEPELILPKVPAYVWLWNDSPAPFNGARAIPSDGEWKAYDYAQTLQLEQGMGEGRAVVELCGDYNGQASDSTCLLPGRRHATYEVHLDESGPGYDAVQYNQAVNLVYGYKFPRAVRREKLAGVEDAKAKVGLFSQEYERAQERNTDRWETYQKDLAAYQLRQAQAQQAASKSGGLFSSLISYFFSTGSEPEPAAAAAEPEPSAAAVGAKVFLPAAPSCLLLIGPPDEVPKVRQQVLDDIEASYKVSVKPLALGQDMTLEGARDSIVVHLADCELSEVEVEIAEGSKLKLRALGEKALLRAEREIAEWQALQALRSSEVQFPPGWTEISKQNADKPGAVYIEVEVGTQEYEEVEQRLRDVVGPKGVSQRNTFTKKVVKVERVENPMAFRAYDSRRRVLQKTARNNGNANELWVKHSTGKTDPKIICEGEEGLDYRYSAWGMFGRAAYTAEDANYSDNANYRHEIALPDGTMQRQMLLCRVAAGTIAEETYDANTTQNFIKPPPGFDSVRGDVVPGTGQFAIMVYSIDQAYPAYLITYEP